MRIRLVSALALVLGATVVSMQTAAAQNEIEDNLSSYTGVNAQGYLGPLRDALGGTMNAGVFNSARVPVDGLHARLDLRAMLISFSEGDRTFRARTEDYFPNAQTVTAPTVVGDEQAVTITDPSTGARFTFPGGFNIDRFALAVPQLTVGSIWGTEAVGRYIAVDTGDIDLGNISLWGLGGRHNVSQHFVSLPVDISVSAFFQKLKIGDDFITARTLTYGVQAGKGLGPLDVYGGLSNDSVKLDVRYIPSDRDSKIEVDFPNRSHAHLTLGATAHLGFLSLNGEFNQAEQSGFAVALGLGL